MPERAKPKLVEEVTAPTVKTKSRARSYAVGCKLPSGLILDLFKEEEFEESMPGAGSRMRKVWRRNFEDNGQRIVLTGTFEGRGEATIGAHKHLLHGRGITRNVDAVR
jgi:hypothetical protein